MIRNAFKRVVIFVLVMSLWLSNAISVAAEGLVDTLDNEVNTETEADYAQDTSYSRLRGNNLNYGTSTITRLSSMEITIDGITQCHHECDEVYLYLYLERKVDGVYSTYKYWEFVDYNVSSLSRDIKVIVPSGYYYRIRGYHAAKDGSKEAVRTLTQGVLVD